VLEVIRSGREITYDSVALCKDGTRIPVEFIVRTMAYQGERVRMTIVRGTSRPCRRAVAHPLPGASRRADGAAEPRRLPRACRAGDRQRRVEGRALALLFVDIDHFKRVNDSLGHLAGDTLLQVLARRITGALRTTDLVGALRRRRVRRPARRRAGSRRGARSSRTSCWGRSRPPPTSTGR